MKLEHIAGEAMFVDYVGKKLHIVNKQTGEIEDVEVFAAILPSSQYTYVEACRSQKLEDFIRCCENALRFYGGVPKMIVCDNLKSAVTRSSKYEAQINRSFRDFARHYNPASVSVSLLPSSKLKSFPIIIHQFLKLFGRLDNF